MEVVYACCGHWPSGDWWAIKPENHSYLVLEEYPSAGYVQWRSYFKWLENKWPNEHWCWSFGHWWSPFYHDYWYIHEFNVLKYGARTVKDNWFDVMDIHKVYSNMPSPCYYSTDEPCEEEFECFTQEPESIDVGTWYTVWMEFKKKPNYVKYYTMYFESEFGDNTESPPCGWKSIQFVDYSNPNTLSYGELSFETPIILYNGTNGYPIPYEYVTVRGCEGKWLGVKCLPSSSPQGLRLYIGQRYQLLFDAIYCLSPGEEVDAVVTFQRPLSPTEYQTLLKTYEVKVKFMIFASSVGGGEIRVSYEDPYPEQELATFEEDIMEDLSYEHFKLVEGIIAIRCKVKVMNLLHFQSSDEVVLVDLGPMEVIKQYKNFAPTTYMWIPHLFYELPKLRE
jgi:hypothetical protein